MNFKYKAGFVGLFGLPNAGKSTLLNALIGEKVGIITSKPQTTRQSVCGIYSNEKAQFILADAPGLIRGEKGLNYFLEKESERVAQDSDVLVCVLNIDHDNPEKLIAAAKYVQNFSKPWIVVISKSDIRRSHRIDHLKRLLREEGWGDTPVVSLSATTEEIGKLREKFFNAVYEFLPASESPLYPTGLFTTQTSKDLASELIREKCFEFLRDEIPYGLAIDIRKYDESKDKIIKVYADILINKSSHKSIVLGSKGSQIKKIGVEARKSLEKNFGKKFYLELFVKVKPNWIKSHSALKDLGYVCEV